MQIIIGIVCAVVKVVIYSLFNIFSAKKGPYYVLETSYIMFVKLCY